MELRIPSYGSIELGHKLREVDPLHFDKHFGATRRGDAFATLDHEDQAFPGGRKTRHLGLVAST